MDIQRLYRCCGSCLDYCQRVEHDVKLLLSILSTWRGTRLALDGRETLGQTIAILEEMDREALRPYLAPEDYMLLKGLRNKRNFLVHDSFVSFLYLENEKERMEAFERSCRKVEDFERQLESLWKAIEDARVKAYEDYKRAMVG